MAKLKFASLFKPSYRPEKTKPVTMIYIGARYYSNFDIILTQAHMSVGGVNIGVANVNWLYRFDEVG